MRCGWDWDWGDGSKVIWRRTSKLLAVDGLAAGAVAAREVPSLQHKLDRQSTRFQMLNVRFFIFFPLTNDDAVWHD